MRGDIFRPNSEPARTIYDALDAAILSRKKRNFERERAAVVAAVNRYTAGAGLVPLTDEQIDACERHAMGHVDYMAKWAYALADAIRRQPKETT